MQPTASGPSGQRPGSPLRPPRREDRRPARRLSKGAGNFADPGRYIGPSQTQDNSKKIDFDAIYNTSINTNDPKQAATSFQRAHEQLNSMSQRQLQGMYR